MKGRVWLLVAVGLMAASGCTSQEPPDLGQATEWLAHPGPWLIPLETLAIGDEQYVAYTAAGPWTGPDGCSGGWEPGTRILRDYLAENFPQISAIGGYSCRSVNGNGAVMSLHAVGRALDVFIPVIGTAREADNDLGDPVGNWLIENAQAIGIQYIIWDEWTWNASRAAGDKDRMYGGAHPHNDHLHVELSVAAAVQTVDWFSELVTPPDELVTPPPLGCEPLGADGGIVDELDACFESFGTAAYWRVEDAGHEERLLWTNAWNSTAASNWARWHVVVSEAGEYDVEVFLTPPYAVYAETRYAVRANGASTNLYIDQSAESGWVPLGRFGFAEGHDQWVSVFDNVPGVVGANQHIVVDAVRLLRAPDPGEDGGIPPIDPPPSDEPPIDDPPFDDGGLADGGVSPGPPTLRGDGCAAAAGASGGVSGWTLLLMLAAGAMARRRTRRTRR